MSEPRTFLAFSDITFEGCIERAASILQWATDEMDLAKVNAWVALADSYMTLGATIRENDE